MALASQVTCSKCGDAVSGALPPASSS